MRKTIVAWILLASPILAAPLGHEAALQALMPDRGRLLNTVFPGGHTGDENDITPDQVREYERVVGKRAA